MAPKLALVIVYIQCILWVHAGKPMSATSAAVDAGELSIDEIEGLEGLEVKQLQSDPSYELQSVPDYLTPFVQNDSPVRVRFHWPSQLRRKRISRRHLLQGSSAPSASETPAGQSADTKLMQGSALATKEAPAIPVGKQADAPAAVAGDMRAMDDKALAADPAPSTAGSVPGSKPAEAPPDAAAATATAAGQLGMAAAPAASQSDEAAQTPTEQLGGMSAGSEDSELLGPAAAVSPDLLEQLHTALELNWTDSSGNLSDLELAGGSKKPGKPGPDLPPIDPKPVGPKPPCQLANGLQEQNGVCVCKPGYGVNPGYKSCSQCLKGWFSLGGPVTTARCRPCPELTTSNEERTACVTNIDVPDVNDALCSKCFDRLTPFDPPACCPKGQVCCGKYGCCHPLLCFNNATTGYEPFCCEGGNCPFDQSSLLNCCPSGTRCLNLTATAPTANGQQQCCPIGGECRASPDVSAVCCNPNTDFCFRTESRATTGVVTPTSVCCNKAQTTCGTIGSGDARCCDLGKYCIDNQKCCNSTSSQLCLTPGTTVATVACCDPPNQCLTAPFTNAKYCCAPPNNVVCGTSCCQTYPAGTNVCLIDNTCCPVARVCTSPLYPNQQTCCPSGQTCNAVTGQCGTSTG